MTRIQDLNPDDRVDCVDRCLVKGLRLGALSFVSLVLFLTAYALVEAGWVAWATVGIFAGVGVGLALIILLIIFLLS